MPLIPFKQMQPPTATKTLNVVVFVVVFSLSDVCIAARHWKDPGLQRESEV